MPGRLRVVLVAPLPPPNGGIATWTRLMLQEADRRPDLVVEHIDISPRWRAVHDLNAAKRIIGGGVQGIRDWRRFARAIARTRPDAVHLCTSGSLATIRDALVLSLARRRGIRSVYHLHFGRVPELARRGGWEWRALRHAAGMASTVAPLDAATEATIRDRMPSARVARVPNCIDVPAVRAEAGATAPVHAAGPPRIAYVGWVVATKGVRELVGACGTLAAPVALDLVGPCADSFRQELEGLAARTRQAAGWFRCVGELPHAAAMQRMAQADVVALPSYTEGFPNVVLEAMALGRPIVATSVGAIPEILDGVEGPCGLCVPPGDTASLADALARVLADEPLRRRLAGSASRTVEARYAAQAVLATWMGLWEGDGQQGSL